MTHLMHSHTNAKRYFRYWWYDTWAPEWLALFLGFCTLCAVLALLGTYNQEAITAWSFPGAVSINAVIAALNTVSKTLTAFVLCSALGQWKWIVIDRRHKSLSTFVKINAASQGPLGSLMALGLARHG